MEMLSSTPTRSAFLQSLQLSRERRETSGPEQSSLDKSLDKYSSKSSSFTPRRLSLSPSRAVAAEVKPAINATPSMQSKLASHAFTLSRSSNSTEEDRCSSVSASRDSFTNFNYGLRTPSTALNEPAFTVPDSSLRAPLPSEVDACDRPSSRYQSLKSPIDFTKVSKEDYKFDKIDYKGSQVSDYRRQSRDYSQFKKDSATEVDYQPPKQVKYDKYEKYKGAEDTFSLSQLTQPPQSSPSVAQPVSNNHEQLKSIIQAEVTSAVSSLRNDLQSLHVEMIKQSLAQQATLRSLFETYLPMTGQLMDALTAAREENERLKLLLSDLRGK